MILSGLTVVNPMLDLTRIDLLSSKIGTAAETTVYIALNILGRALIAEETGDYIGGALRPQCNLQFVRRRKALPRILTGLCTAVYAAVPIMMLRRSMCVRSSMSLTIIRPGKLIGSTRRVILSKKCMLEMSLVSVKW